MGRICMATHNELEVTVADRNVRVSRLVRGRILDEFVAMTGLHCKHAMRLHPPFPDGRCHLLAISMQP